jgi:hypothetical protein
MADSPTTAHHQHQAAAAASAAASINTSNHVYVKSKEYAWVPARLLETSGGTATVSIPLYKTETALQSDGGRGAYKFDTQTVTLADYPAGALLLQNVDHEGHLNEVEDMVELSYLHEVSEFEVESNRLYIMCACVVDPLCTDS